MKRLLKRLFAALGLRVTRHRPGNRFDAIEDSLRLLVAAGYAPGLVIDGGANAGQWSGLALPLFPAARFHLVEPQPACAPVLATLARSNPRVTVHRFALTAPGTPSVRMVGGGERGGGTGAWVARQGETAADAVEVPATTLDALFADLATPGLRPLLKLDVEGHEVAALTGAERLLDAVEVILAELQFYEIGGNGLPCFRQLLAFLDARGFELYDFAALSPRPRDQRLRMGDALFVRRGSALLSDDRWE